MKMTIEEQFFKVFEIETQHVLDIKTNQFVDFYPEITAEKLLQLICILNKYLILVYGLGERYNKYKYNDLKKEILENCCTYAKYFKIQKQEKRLEDFNNEVRKLFEEE